MKFIVNKSGINYSFNLWANGPFRLETAYKAEVVQEVPALKKPFVSNACRNGTKLFTEVHRQTFLGCNTTQPVDTPGA